MPNKIPTQPSPLTRMLGDLNNLRCSSHKSMQQFNIDSEFVTYVNYLKSKVNVNEEISKIKEKELSVVFPGVPAEKYKEIFEGQQITQYIFKIPEYRTLAQYVLELVEANERTACINYLIILEDLIERQKNIQRDKDDQIELAKFFDVYKKDLFEKSEQCKLIKEVQ